MDPLKHPKQLETLLAGYVLGDLTPAEIAHVNQLLERNPDLLVELQRLQVTLAVLPLSLPVTSPSQQLETRILQAAQAELATATHSPAKPMRQMRLRSWKWGGAIAAVVIAGLGIETYQLHQKLTATQLENQRLHQQLATTHQELSRYQTAMNLLRQPKNRFLTLIGTNPKLKSSGSLVIVPTEESAILVLRDVAPLPKGKVYRLWALVDGQKVTCGDFLPNDRGDVFLQLPLDQWGGTTEVIVTVEPDRVMSIPVGEMVIIGS